MTCGKSLSQKLDELKTAASGDAQLAQNLSGLLDEARALAQKPIWKRAHTLADYAGFDGVNAREMDYKDRCDAMKNRDNANAHAGALQDSRLARILLQELPFLAAAYRLCRDEKLLEALSLQFKEILTWDQFQRQGWTLNVDSPAISCRDGVWLATGTLVQAIGLCLEILPDEALEKSIEDGLLQAIRRERQLVYSDWIESVPWYVRQEKVQSNQWIVPNSVLTIGSAILGETDSDEYRLGKQNTDRTLEYFGDDGAVPEGFDYAVSWTANSLLAEDYFRARAGDGMVGAHPFFRNLGMWLSSAYQPGGYCVNAFDWWSGCRNAIDINKAIYLCQIATFLEDPYLNWMIKAIHRQTPPSLFGLLSLNIRDQDTAVPPLYSAYDHARWFTWRSCWEREADGVWVRGQHHLDFHNHSDAGHVNYIKNGKLVLMECGTIDYSNPESPEFRKPCSHNVVCIGDNREGKKNVDAKFLSVAADGGGGEVTVNLSDVYDSAESYNRTAKWDKSVLEVSDSITLHKGKKETITQFWHFGSECVATIEKQSPCRYIVMIPKGRMVLEPDAGKIDWIFRSEETWFKGNFQGTLDTPEICAEITSTVPIALTQEKGRDHTMDIHQLMHQHTMITVMTTAPVEQLLIHIKIIASC